MTTFGSDSVCLELPGSAVTLNGLSSRQQATIVRDYGAFVRPLIGGPEVAHVVCRSAQAGSTLDSPAERYCSKGYYVAEKHRRGAGVAVHGFKFEAYFDRHARPGAAGLSVRQEPDLTEPIVLENFLRILIAHRVLDSGGVLLHSSGVVWDGCAYLFCGASGVGKTTLARKAIAAGFPVLSDDINLVTPSGSRDGGSGGRESGYRVHRVPFTGELGRGDENLAGAGSFPLGGITLLSQAACLSVGNVPPAAAVAGLLVGCPFVNDDPEELPLLLDALTGLVFSNPVRRLGLSLTDPFEAAMKALVEFAQ